MGVVASKLLGQTRKSRRPLNEPSSECSSEARAAFHEQDDLLSLEPGKNLLESFQLYTPKGTPMQQDVGAQTEREGCHAESSAVSAGSRTRRVACLALFAGSCVSATTTLATVAAMRGAGFLAQRDVPAVAPDSAGKPAEKGAGEHSKVKHVNCMAHSEYHCLLDEGCRWFAYAGSSCPRCEEWFGHNHKTVTGCRDWDPQMYCQTLIFKQALRKSGADPKASWFGDAIRQYSITQGNSEVHSPHRKRMYCDVWCDDMAPKACYGQPKVMGLLHGVNYGGRFVPEQFLGLPGTDEILFKGLGKNLSRKDRLSLCDVSTADAGERMTRFLDENIKQAHFTRMAQLGFRIVRLPVGYWNFIDVPGGGTPRGPPEAMVKWRNLQRILPAAKYQEWLHQVFVYASAAGLQVLLDLHGAPGGQSGNQNTGCYLGMDSVFYFPTYPAGTSWNTWLGVYTIKEMAKLCAAHGPACYGVELLNEPFDPGPGSFTRESLQSFYDRAIRTARLHLDREKPIVIMEWAPRLWYWRHARNAFHYEVYGRIVFSTHLYMYPEPPVTDQQRARGMYAGGLKAAREFALNTGYDIMVSEYALNSHGSGKADDHFDYGSWVDWFVHQLGEFAIGSMVWNFDSFYPAWGPVQQVQVGNNSAIRWREVLRDNIEAQGPNDSAAGSLEFLLDEE